MKRSTGSIDATDEMSANKEKVLKRKNTKVALLFGGVPENLITCPQTSSGLLQLMADLRTTNKGLFLYGSDEEYDARCEVAAAILWYGCWNAMHQCFWLTAETAKLASRRFDRMRFSDEESYYARMERVEWLVIEDFGSEKMTEDWGPGLATLIAVRAQQKHSTILIASSITPKSLWEEYPGSLTRSIERHMRSMSV